jgi:hypothetical protein
MLCLLWYWMVSLAWSVSVYYVIMPLLCHYAIIMSSCRYYVIMSLSCSVQMHLINAQSYEHNTSSINETQTKYVFRHQIPFKSKEEHNRICYLWNVKHFVPFLIGSPGPKVQVNYCHQLGVRRLSSVNFSHFKLLLRNHLADWNQT